MQEKPDANDLDDLILGAKVKNVPSPQKLGRPSGPKKKNTLVAFEVDLLKRIDRHNGGNRSVFISNIIKKYLDSEGLE